MGQNALVQSFDHQYLWKDSSDILDFLDGDSHQFKEISEGTIWSGMPATPELGKTYQRCFQVMWGAEEG